MRITYLLQSGFMIETKKAILVIDSFNRMDPVPVNSEKPLIFMASHTHPDHFNPKIFKYNGPNVSYLLSYDIKEKVEYRGWLNDIEDIDISYIKAGETKEYPVYDITVNTLKSTDRGVAFVINADGQNIYHSGDLNEWNFDDTAKDKFGDMRARYRKEIDKLDGMTFEAAFIPVDPRLGNCYTNGPEYFLKKTKVNHLFPIHMWEKYEYIGIFMKCPFLNGLETVIHHPDNPGKNWDI